LWQKASARLVVDDADLALLAEFYPDLLAPQGRAKINLSFTSQAEVRGEIVVSGARTQPISDLGPLRDINLQLVFAGRTMQVEKASAFVGASPMSVTGSADLSGTEWLKGQLPPLRMSILATNVPLSRTPEATIRSDLNLVLTKTNGASPLLTGSVRLGNSFFLSDLGALVGGKVAKPAQRPPYFSIEEPLLANWRLSLRIDGTRFLKVRSPVFNGEVSANLDLQGTLKDPVSVGTVEINSGTVRFPFASFEVKSSFVTLSRDRPYEPKLAITAASKQFGYDLNLQVTGWADSAVLHLTSNPPLSYEQILLMITAGELPREDS
jgi:translocation and assembly module TamB